MILESDLNFQYENKEISEDKYLEMKEKIAKMKNDLNSQLEDLVMYIT